MKTDKRLGILIKENLRYVVVITLITIISFFSNAVYMYSLGQFLLRIILEKGHLEIIQAITLVFISLFFMKIIDFILTKGKSEFQSSFNDAYRKKLLMKLFSLGPAYVENKKNGELVSTLWEKVEWIGYYLYYYIPTLISIMIFSLVLSIVCFRYNCVISFVVLIGGTILVILPGIFRKILRVSGRDEWEENDDFYSTCLDGLKGITTLKSFNVNDRHRAIVSEESEKNRASIMRNLKVTTLNTRSAELIIFLTEIVVGIIGAYSALSGTITATELLVLYVLMKSWSDGASRIFGAWLRGNKGMSAFFFTDEILCMNQDKSLTDSETDDSCGRISFETDITFKNVDFSYMQDNNALSGLNLTIKKGSKVAIVGSSGSGKSTLLNLLFGFYGPESGEIVVDGYSLGKNNVKAFQDLITVIWQDCHIFHMSCYDNIRIAKPDATKDEIYEAAKKANIHDKIISLPGGYDTFIGDGGTVFSGGEKQRIVIARAFLRNTPILLLDEATSSLDRKNEREIQSCLIDLCKGRTVISVSHRMDTVKDADQIYVLDSGKLIEKGTHCQLIDKNGKYNELMCAGY